MCLTLAFLRVLAEMNHEACRANKIEQEMKETWVQDSIDEDLPQNQSLHL